MVILTGMEYHVKKNKAMGHGQTHDTYSGEL